MLNLILFGPPGSGKGTQSVRLAKKFNLIHLSTGDMLRREIAEATELGLAAQAIMARGELVSDKIVIGMIESMLDKNPDAEGFIFDGFPRTTVQAIALDELLEKHGTRIAATLSLEVNKAELVVRLLERGKDSGRADDQNEAIIENRIQEYLNKTSPLIDYYTHEGKYKAINGVGEIDHVFDLLCDQVEHLEAGEAHGEGVLQSHAHTSHHLSKNNKHHKKNLNSMINEENNNQHNNGHEEHAEKSHESHEQEHHESAENKGTDEHSEETSHTEETVVAQEEVKAEPVKAAPKKKAAPAKKKTAPAAKKKAAPAPKKKKAAPAKKKKAAKPAKKKVAKKAAPKKKTAKKAAKPAKKKKVAKKAAPKKKTAKKAAPKKKSGSKKPAPKKKVAKKGGKSKAKKKK